MDRIHVKAPENWINDPNGFIYYKGKYHLFYQHFPYEPRWGTMHWGHCISSDLVHWQHEKIALFPSKYDDRNGCFSGSAVEADGKLNLFYTGVRYLEEDPDDIHLCRQNRFVSAQMRMVSEDGIHFDNIRNKETVIPVLTDPETGDAAHTRDPKVWRGSDAWYMVLGTTQNEKGKLLIYRSEDLQHWELKNSVKGTGNFGWMWECPDYFEVNGSQILLVSPMGLLKDGNREANQAVCAFVDFQEETCSMNISDRWQFLDYGLDLYAPQSTVDEQGRRILTAWARMPEPVEGQWMGMLCGIRVVETENDHLYFRPHPNVMQAYSREITSPAEASEGCYRACLELEEGETVNVGGYQIRAAGNRIHTDRHQVFPSLEHWRKEFQTPKLTDGYHLDIYVDPNLIEVYVNQGEYVITSTVYGLQTILQTDTANPVRLYTLEN